MKCEYVGQKCSSYSLLSLFGLLYIIAVIGYALLYWWYPNTLATKDLTLLKSIYFSVVTITTLGYGEITPATSQGMMLASSEAVVGVILIGLFMSSLWHSFVKKMEITQRESIDKGLSEQNLRKLNKYYKLLKPVIDDYFIAFAELTTPLISRKSEMVPNSAFKFSDLRDLFKISLLTKSGISKSVVRLYFEKQDSLTSELKFLLANLDLSDFPDIQECIIEFLSLSKAKDIRDSLFSYENKKAKGKLLTEMLGKMIAKAGDCPELNRNQSNLIDPAIILYQTLKLQLEFVKRIAEELGKLATQR